MDPFSINSGKRVDIPYDIPDHEVLLSFNNDDDATLFMEWFEHHKDSFQGFVDYRQTQEARDR